VAELADVANLQINALVFNELGLLLELSKSMPPVGGALHFFFWFAALCVLKAGEG
jgi:hypothetical protein